MSRSFGTMITEYSGFVLLSLVGFHQLGFAVAQSVQWLGFKQDDRGIVVRFPAEAIDLLFCTVSRAALGPFQPSFQRVPRYLLLGVMRPNREAGHSPCTAPRLMTATVPQLLPYAFIAWKNFTYLLALFGVVLRLQQVTCMYSGILYSNLEKRIHYPNSGYSQFVLHPSQLNAHIIVFLHFSQHTRESSTS